MDRAYTAEEMRAGPAAVSEYILAHPSPHIPLPITIILVGGAVSVLHLQNRPSTLDIDYYCPSDSALALLDDATRFVAQAHHWPESWCNTDVSFFIESDPNNDDFHTKAVEQGVRLFASEGLEAYAAQWEWQLIQKSRRFNPAVKNRKDDIHLMDALEFLKIIVERRGGEPVKRGEFAEMHPIGAFVDDEHMDRLRDEYLTMFGSPGLKD